MEGYTDNSQILNYNSPPPFFFIIHVDHTETNKFQQYSKNVYLTAHCFLENTIFNCYQIYLQHFP